MTLDCGFHPMNFIKLLLTSFVQLIKNYICMFILLFPVEDWEIGPCSVDNTLISAIFVILKVCQVFLENLAKLFKFTLFKKIFPKILPQNGKKISKEKALS